jgi:hypothetical protein
VFSPDCCLPKSLRCILKSAEVVIDKGFPGDIELSPVFLDIDGIPQFVAFTGQVLSLFRYLSQVLVTASYGKSVSAHLGIYPRHLPHLDYLFPDGVSCFPGCQDLPVQDIAEQVWEVARGESFPEQVLMAMPW